MPTSTSTSTFQFLARPVSALQAHRISGVRAQRLDLRPQGVAGVAVAVADDAKSLH
jgi:hypothetical protein